MNKYLDLPGLQDYTQKLTAKYDGRYATADDFGSPLVASTVAQMTDHDRVYVYTGSETGYVNGDWYYWDGSAWVSGGAYNSVAIDYDDLVQVIKITNMAITMGEINTTLDSVNTAGKHVVFDVSALGAGMYLCTIYLGAGYYRISDLVTGFEKTGFYSNSDKLVDILNSVPTTTGKHYTIQWDKTNAACTRLNDAASITTDTTNFGHFGSVNPNYNNPFDDIYPWSGRKLCNIDLDAYLALTSEDDITDCVTAWEGDVGFDYEDQYGVWVYTPAFFGRSYSMGNYRYFDVTDEHTQNNIEYPAMITGRWFGKAVTLTIGGVSKTCNLPVLGIPLPMNMGGETMADMHTFAKNAGMSLVDIYAYDASVLLMVVEYATLNGQAAIGRGCCDLREIGMHPNEDVTASTQVKVSVSADYRTLLVVGAAMDINYSGVAAQYVYITDVETTGNVTTLTFDHAVTATTAYYMTLHGCANMKDEDIGSHSGYIGVNGTVNAYYRGEILFGNRYQYTLGAYRQNTTNKIWICGKDLDPDDYDEINTSVHTDTGLTLPTGFSEYIKDLGEAEGLSIPPFCVGGTGNSNNPVGDWCFATASASADTVLQCGGSSYYGEYAGPFFQDWRYGSTAKHWAVGCRPRLKNPR